MNMTAGARAEWHVFTDGSCLNNGSAQAVGGWAVFVGDGSPHNVSGCVREGKVTNQTMELAAILEALRMVHLARRGTCVICTDSMYAINCLTKWLPGWVRNGWRTKTKKPVQNMALLQEVHALATTVGCRFLHVQAHQPEPSATTDPVEHFLWSGNRRADRMAARAAVEGGGRTGCRIIHGANVHTSKLFGGT